VHPEFRLRGVGSALRLRLFRLLRELGYEYFFISELNDDGYAPVAPTAEAQGLHEALVREKGTQAYRDPETGRIRGVAVNLKDYPLGTRLASVSALRVWASPYAVNLGRSVRTVSASCIFPASGHCSIFI
jgi:hypothetical protein